MYLRTYVGFRSHKCYTIWPSGLHRSTLHSQSLLYYKIQRHYHYLFRKFLETSLMSWFTMTRDSYSSTWETWRESHNEIWRNPHISNPDHHFFSRSWPHRHISSSKYLVLVTPSNCWIPLAVLTMWLFALQEPNCIIGSKAPLCTTEHARRCNLPMALWSDLREMLLTKFHIACPLARSHLMYLFFNFLLFIRYFIGPPL